MTDKERMSLLAEIIYWQELSKTALTVIILNAENGGKNNGK